MTSPKHDVLVHPGARFASDFSRLITDIDRLMVDIGDEIERRSTRSNGHVHKTTNLDGTISTLRVHAHSFLKSLRHPPLLAPEHNGTRPKRDEASPRIDDLVVHLSRAQDLTSVGEAIGNYCRKAFHSPAGMIFLERNGDLQLLSEWQSRQFGKPIPVDLAKNGPAARVFRTGVPAFFNHGGPPRSNLSERIHRALRRCHARSLAFLPLSAANERIGVLCVLLPHLKEAGPQASDLLRVGPVISGWIERARAYEDAVAARNRIENAMQVKDEFLSMLSHELRNPMMPILGWAVALSSGPLPAEKQNLALEGIVRNVRALNYLIEDLFDAVRISSGKLRLQPATTRIQEVAREALGAIQPSAENKKLRISTDISEGIPPFRADSRRLLQVLMNLLNNAVKFTPPGGSIALSIRKQANSVECIVSDSGRGIERKFLPFVFDRLRQGNRSWKGQAAGLGLGLAIVREIVELHGGSIQALSNGPDKGSTFTFRLPLRKKTNGRLGNPPAKSDPRLRKNNSPVTE